MGSFGARFCFRNLKLPPRRSPVFEVTSIVSTMYYAVYSEVVELIDYRVIFCCGILENETFHPIYQTEK